MSKIVRCECSEMQYRNNTDGSRDFRVKGNTGCAKCRGNGTVAKCSTCEGCGLLPGSKICPDCSGHGVKAAEATKWMKSRINVPA